MAESIQGIRALLTGDIQSILEGESQNNSQRSLPEVPDATIDAIGLSSIRQNLSLSFSHLQRGLANWISRSINQTNQPQHAIDMEVDAEQLSPCSIVHIPKHCQGSVYTKPA